MGLFDDDENGFWAARFGMTPDELERLKAKAADRARQAYDVARAEDSSVMKALNNGDYEGAATAFELYNNNDEQCAQLKASQKAWVVYRDAECARWSSSSGGSADAMNGGSCLANLMVKRAE